MAADDMIEGYLLSFASEYEDVVYLARLSEDTWQIDFSDDRSLLVEIDLEGAALAVVVPLGKPQDQRRLQVYSALLTYSSLWQDTGGIRGALDGSGNALLIGQLALVEVGEARLHDALVAMRESSRMFIALMSGPVQSADSADDLMMFKI